MKHKRKLMLSAVLLICFCMASITAQEIIPASGGEASGAGGTVCYTIGQLAYTKYTGANGSVTEGVQQPYEISVVSGINEAAGINLAVLAYPNPTTDHLTLRIDKVENLNLSYQMYDMKGQLLLKEKIISNETSIVISSLVPATYFVKVLEYKKEIKTFKIIKAQ